MEKEKASSGGKAEATGSNYEILVASWYAHLLLVGDAASTPFGLPATCRIQYVHCQSEAPVDDVNAGTSDKGIIFVQAKRSVSLTTGEKSSLVKAMDQFVRQFKACAEPDGKHAWSRPLDAARDRLVLATRSESSSKITKTLPEMLRRIRSMSEVQTLALAQIAVTQVEKEVATAIEAAITDSWTNVYGKAPTASEMSGLLRLIWVQTLDVEVEERDQKAIVDDFRRNLLEDSTQADLAFSELYKIMGLLRAERTGTDRPVLLQKLSDAGIGLKALPDFRNDIEDLAKWTAARLEAAPGFTRLLTDKPGLTIERAAWADFQRGANDGSFLLVGEPGAGKSGFMYRLWAKSGGDSPLGESPYQDNAIERYCSNSKSP